MKIPIAWLKEFVSIHLSPAALAHRLTMAGLEVEAIEGAGDKTIFEISITPNRGDCLSILGLARETSALEGKPLSLKKTSPPKGELPIKNFIAVKFLDKKNCPRYMARGILGLAIKPSPPWLQKRLEEVGSRPINNVVDCTNYVMWELGHPLHTFDQSFLRNRQIVIRREKAPSRFTALDGQTHSCDPEDLFICDGVGPVALAGIMGGANSEVRKETKDIVIEAAYFDPKRIHATAKRLNLTSESSYRFERGVDPNGVENALHRVVGLILETAGGKPTKDWIDCYPQKIKPVTLSFNIEEVWRLLGVKISSSQIRHYLTCLGFELKGGSKSFGSKSFKVRVPPYRSDVSRPVDLIEEIARLFGYDKIPLTRPVIQTGLSQRPKEADCLKETIHCLRGLGYTEAIHLCFVSLEEANVFDDPSAIVRLENPLAENQSALRSSLMPGLLRGASFNSHRQRKDLKLFELQKVFAWKNGGLREKRNLGFIAFGEEGAVDFFSLKGVLEQLTFSLYLDPFQYSSEDLPSFLVPNSAGTLFWDGKKIGWAGLLHPKVLQKWAIEIPVFACELAWEELVKGCQKSVRKFEPIAKFPFVERDVALIVDSGLPAQKILEAMEGANIPWMQRVQFFDLYKGKELPQDKKSLAFHIQYASKERTLTNEEVAKAHEALVAHLEKTLSAKLR